VEELYQDLKEVCSTIYRKIRSGLGEEYYLYQGVGAGGDRTSGIDRFAEELFLQKLSPYGRIISEEAGEVGDGEFTIVLDPIDGSDNLLSSFPYYGSSIAVQKEGRTIFSCIVNFANADLFIKGENFYKKGSLLHDELYDVYPNSHAKIGLFEKAYANPAVVRQLKSHGLKFRSPGAVALSLAYARYVRFVIFIGDIRPYDIEAGLHQCEGLHIYRTDGQIVVCKEESIFNTIKKIVQRKSDGH